MWNIPEIYCGTFIRDYQWFNCVDRSLIMYSTQQDKAVIVDCEGACFWFSVCTLNTLQSFYCRVGIRCLLLLVCFDWALWRLPFAVLLYLIIRWIIMCWSVIDNNNVWCAMGQFVNVGLKVSRQYLRGWSLARIICWVSCLKSFVFVISMIRGILNQLIFWLTVFVKPCNKSFQVKTSLRRISR